MLCTTFEEKFSGFHFLKPLKINLHDVKNKLKSNGYSFTEEKLGKAERTELDAQFENLLARADKTEEHTKRILSCIEGYLLPNPSASRHEYIFNGLLRQK
uniref:BAR domain-containing protein n=1 Tax=Romanomermis culicivorax TaxID=13658 RepID=A0A915KZQ8_ROMCU